MKLSYCNFEAKVNNSNVFMTLSNREAGEDGANNVVLSKDLMDEVVKFVTSKYTLDQYKSERVIIQLYTSGHFIIKFDTPKMRLHKKFIFKKVAMNQNTEKDLHIIVTLEKFMNELTIAS